jgi:hypothetical protein
MTDGVSSSPASPTSVPFLRLSRPSQTSAEDSETLTLASADADFARLAKARYAPYTCELSCHLYFLVCVGLIQIFFAQTWILMS